MISRRGSSASGVGGHTSLGEGWILISRRRSTLSGVGGHTLLLEDAFDIEGPTTERNIVGVAHFYACANPLTLF